MPRFPTPFSFVTWDECFRTGYDRFCQEVWDCADYPQMLYPPKIPFRRLPWATAGALYDVPECGENIYRRQGTVSVWLLLCPDLDHYFFTADDSCEWEPLEAALFWDDLGFILCPDKYDLAATKEPEAIADLLARFSTPHEPHGYTISHLFSFADDVLESCRKKSIAKACGFYCVFDFDYCGSPVYGKFCSGLVEYLGAFSYSPQRSSDKTSPTRQF